MQSSNHSICICYYYIIVLLSVIICAKCKDTSMMIYGCRIQMCSYDDPITRFVQFPFRIQNPNPLPRYCGYPGFDLFCDEANRLVVNLTNSGVFFVQAIDYGNHELWLNDPDNCLPKKLLSLNHHVSNSSNFSPFVPMQEQIYWMYNCSNDHLKSFTYTKKIECLSGSNYGVFASTHEILSNSSTSKGCKKLGPIRFPDELGSQKMNFSDLRSDLKLTWVEPKCGGCFQSGGQCGFIHNSSLDVGCYNIPRRGLPKSAIIAVVLAFAAPLGFLGFCIAYFMVNANCQRRRTRRISGVDVALDMAPAVAPMSPTQQVPSGLDRSTIETYPKVVLGESRRLPKPDDKNCPICLGEYLPKETLRTLPHCSHSFHAECIDEWLTMNGSCPLCRNSPSHNLQVPRIINEQTQ